MERNFTHFDLLIFVQSPFEPAVPTLWCRFPSVFGSFIPVPVARSAAVCTDSTARGSTTVSVTVAGGALSSDSSTRASRYWF